MSYVRRNIVLSALIAVVFGVLEAGSFSDSRLHRELRSLLQHHQPRDHRSSWKRFWHSTSWQCPYH
jgi:hypothetical protein